MYIFQNTAAAKYCCQICFEIWKFLQRQYLHINFYKNFNHSDDFMSTKELFYHISALCCEAQSQKYILYGHMRKRWNPEQYMEKLMEYWDEDKNLNLITVSRGIMPKGLEC